MSQAQIKALNTRIHTLEEQLAAHQQQLVNTCAMQMQSLFTNPVMLDSIAHRVLIAAANALAHKASHANERAPELQVLEGYIPGALRAILNEDGSMTVEQQLKGAVNAGGQWESATEQFEEQGILETFAQLMAAYGAQAGRVYYITDTVTAGTYREKLSKELASNVTATAPEDELGTEGPDNDVPDVADGPNGICFDVALQADQSRVTSVMYPLGTSVRVIRDNEEFEAQVDEVQDDDVILVNELDQLVHYVVTGSSLVDLPNTLTGDEEPSVDPVAEEGVFSAADIVSVVLKPWNSEIDGQVELAGDEVATAYAAYDDVTVLVEAGEVVKKAWQLLPQDILLVTRNECIVKEVVVTVDISGTDAAQ